MGLGVVNNFLKKFVILSQNDLELRWEAACNHLRFSPKAGLRAGQAALLHLRAALKAG